jgi:hypothetical protein
MRQRHFTPQEDSWHSFLLQAVIPRAVVQLEGLGKLKEFITSLGCEPATFQLVA